jgi:putative membrane protein
MMITFKANPHFLHLTLLLSTAAALLPPSAPQRLPTARLSLRTDAEAVLDLRRVDTSRSELVSPGESTISRLWDLETWARHQKVGRYWRHLRKWPRSTTARLVLPVCVAFSLWSCVAHALRTRYFPNFAAPLAPLTLISSAVALLLTLRMNLSLLRLQESRLAWGRLVLHARETAGLAATYCAAAPAEAICRHLAVLGWCLKASLRAGEDDSDVVSTMLPPATAETVLAARKRPVALLRGAHAVVAEEVAAGRLDAQAHLSLLTQLHSLNAQIGVCERLLASPVPPTITRHTSRVLLSWLACVPLGLESLGLALPAVALATLGTSYVMVCVEIKLHAPHATDATNTGHGGHRPDRSRARTAVPAAAHELARGRADPRRSG